MTYSCAVSVFFCRAYFMLNNQGIQMNKRKIGLVNYLAYGSGDCLGAGTTALTAAWLLYFFTTFCGLTPIALAIRGWENDLVDGSSLFYWVFPAFSPIA